MLGCRDGKVKYNWASKEGRKTHLHRVVSGIGSIIRSLWEKQANLLIFRSKISSFGLIVNQITKGIVAKCTFPTHYV